MMKRNRFASALRRWCCTLLLCGVASSTFASEEMMHGQIFSHWLLDRLEHRWQEGENTVDWHVRGWVGGDYHRFVFKADGNHAIGTGVEKAQMQFLYSRLIAPFWELQTGLRHDHEPTPWRTYLVVGLEGLAPFWLEVSAAGFLSERGDVTAALEIEQDLLLTQRWILQPRIETHAAAQRVPQLGIASGFNDASVELRLRYEITREFAPYVGIAWTKSVGGAADQLRERGEEADAVALVAGIRAWF